MRPIFTATAALLAFTVGEAQAQSLPRWTSDQACARESSAVTFCQFNERRAEEKISGVWQTLQPQIRKACLDRIASFKQNSYLLLSDCVEEELTALRVNYARQAKRVDQPDPKPSPVPGATQKTPGTDLPGTQSSQPNPPGSEAHSTPHNQPPSKDSAGPPKDAGGPEKSQQQANTPTSAPPPANQQSGQNPGGSGTSSQQTTQVPQQQPPPPPQQSTGNAPKDVGTQASQPNPPGSEAHSTPHNQPPTKDSAQPPKQ